MISKEQLLSQISEEWNRLRVLHQKGGQSDLSIAEKFVEAGWSSGKKEISYEASVYADVQEGCVYMWEMTKEKGSGFSFGSSSESSFQSGTTLFRKVKSRQYGPEGKVYEYELDLGAIPKAVKQASKDGGWKFKTVLSKGKASYPA
ncbi:MAG: hypothetical protein VB108_09040 [Anaerolineaceae bacterium]|nr:hypothetical protein [Anaerolineaceae bacterium]